MYQSRPEISQLRQHLREAREELAQACEAVAQATIIGLIQITSEELPGFVRYLAVSNETEVYWEGFCFYGSGGPDRVLFDESDLMFCECMYHNNPSETWFLHVNQPHAIRATTSFHVQTLNFTLTFLDQTEIPENQNPTS